MGLVSTALRIKIFVISPNGCHLWSSYRSIIKVCRVKILCKIQILNAICPLVQMWRGFCRLAKVRVVGHQTSLQLSQTCHDKQCYKSLRLGLCMLSRNLHRLGCLTKDSFRLLRFWCSSLLGWSLHSPRHVKPSTHYHWCLSRDSLRGWNSEEHVKFRSIQADGYNKKIFGRSPKAFRDLTRVVWPSERWPT